MPISSASSQLSRERLARPHPAKRWLALTASGCLLHAAVALADDDAESNIVGAGAQNQATQVDAAQQSRKAPPDSNGRSISETGEAAARQQGSGETQAQIASLRSRLAAVEEEKTRLTLQLDLLTRKQADLEAQARELDRTRRQLHQSQTAVERAEAQAEALRLELEQLKQQRELVAQNHTAQLTAAELRLREHKERLSGVDLRIQGLEQQLAQREAQIARMEAADARRTEARQELEDRIAELRGYLPAPEGGTVTAAEARARARQDAETLERLMREGQGVRNPQLWQQIRQTENALHRSQFLLARTQGDRTVYRVRPGDSLARISAIVYGDDQAWTRIFEANRHLLDEPDRIPPGFTLVIPE